jgi:phosphoribosylformylglycinamidine synthase
MVGQRKEELGGSIYYDLNNELGSDLPKPDLNEVKNQIFLITECIDRDFCLSCHDISDGGIASTLSEMTFKNEIGCSVNIHSSLRNDVVLFSETGGFVLEVEEKKLKEVKSLFGLYNEKFFIIGTTNNSKNILLNDVIDTPIYALKEAWLTGLREKLK